MNTRQDALQIFNAAIAAVQPARLIPLHLSVTDSAIIISGNTIPFGSFNNIYIIGAGKAAAAMAVITEAILDDYITAGLVVTKYGHALPCSKIKIMEGGHPLPDTQCITAVSETLKLLQKVTQDDIVICLISGGASALWCDVLAGITIQEMQTTFNLLIKSGAGIHEMNAVRKHLSAIKGGQLVKYCNGARLFSLIISDVPGDDMSVIASGPTVENTDSFNDALAVLNKYELISKLPVSVQQYISNGTIKIISHTPSIHSSLFNRTYNCIIGDNAMAIKAAAQKAEVLGYSVHINRAVITGDAVSEAHNLTRQALHCNSTKPVCILQGGETTVKVNGSGTGGRNQHFVLAALNELLSNENTTKDVLLLSGGTDGTDGPTNATGAVGDKNTIRIAKDKALSIPAYLHNFDAYHFFEQTGGLIITGPTQTNVMDIMLAIVY